MKKFFVFTLLILILAAAMTGLTACSKADKPQDAFMGWISQVSAENMRWVFVEAGENETHIRLELDEAQKEAFAAVLAAVENGQAEQIPFTDESQLACFTLTLHEDAEDGGNDKCTFTGIGDNTLILRFDSDVPLGAEGLWQLENPQLYEHISALAEDYRKAEEAKRQAEEDKQAAEAGKENQKYSRITLDVAAAMKNISAENIVQIEPMYNVTAAELVKVLNGAVKNHIDDKAALDKGFEPDKFTVWDIDYVQFKEFSEEINEEIYLSLDLSCDFEE